MRFLCVGCDEPMALKDAIGPDRGSVALVYSCGTCGHEFAMLTNPHETQLVTSLGIEIGPDGEQREAASKCPFTGMVKEMQADDDSVPWTAEATARLAGVPDFVRPMARDGIERFARDKGYTEVDEKVLDEAREVFGF